jgi:hypothetical protein
VTLRDRPTTFGPPAPPKPPASGRPVATPPNLFAPRVQWVNAITGDGKFHSMYVSNGESPNPPVAFLPADAHAKGLLVFDGNAYTATVNSCGGVPNGLWALHIESKKVTSWKASDNVAGSTGFAAGPDGILYVASGSSVTALEPGTLAVKATHKGGSAFSTSPLVFDWKGQDTLALLTTDGQLQLLNAFKLADPALATAAVPGAANYAAGALASYQDAAGTRWILVPTATNVVAYQFDGVSLKQAWTSVPMVTALTPAIINGAIFAVSSGEFRSKNAKETISKSGKAVLHALDPATGKSLWTSGDTITSFVTSGGLAGGGSRIYVSGFDGTQYAFGFPIEK